MEKLTKFKMIINLFLFTLSGSFSVQALELNSGDTKVALVELYTSQSCSSCPPADAWLASLKTSKELWKKFVPIEFHVAYWNHLHWKDKYSKESFSQRQRDYNKVIKSGVFTPQIILNGKNLNGWRFKKKKLTQHNLLVGNLKVTVTEKNNKSLLSYKSMSFRKARLLCFGAVIEGNHKDSITSGENKGRNLTHEFIVKDLQSAFMIRTGKTYKCKLNLKKYNKKEKSALAFWVSNSVTYEIIQATGAYLN